MTKPLQAMDGLNYDRMAVLRHVRNVIKLTVTPSWFGSVPENFGSARAGTLKAHEWQILALLYLPLALISLWIKESRSSSSAQEYAHHLGLLLDNTMCLCTAIRLACSRTVTPVLLERYHRHISSYIQGIGEIFKHARHRPSHHMAQHIHNFLHLFGPVQSLWCYPFERLVGILQRLPSNHKPGMTSFP